MKSTIRTFFAVSLTAVYCFAVSVVTTPFGQADFQHYPASLQEKINTDFTTDLFCHTSQSVSSVSSTPGLAVSNFTKTASGFGAMVHAARQASDAAIAQYTTLLRKVLIKERKRNLIFPFHYFW